MTAALGSGSAPPPSLPQPRPRAPRSILGSAPSRFEATRQPSSGPPTATDLRPNPLSRYYALWRPGPLANPKAFIGAQARIPHYTHDDMKHQLEFTRNVSSGRFG